MTKDQFIQFIIDRFGFPPTNDQMNALRTFSSFLASHHSMPVMILRGSAGTGKTSLVAAMVNALLACLQKVVLMAPTGRAAKVLALGSGYSASTIHRRIYRQKRFGGEFKLNDNLSKNTLFVVDEASMIATYSAMESGFGSGNLLDDLVQYVYMNQNNCRMLLIGDTAQLPPVGEDEAPALMRFVLEGYGMEVFECDLNEVLRQSIESGILWNATRIRRLITHDEATELPKIRFQGFADIKVMPGNELIESLQDSYYHVGMDDTTVVTRSNKRATIYNNGIRNQVLDREEALGSGDQIMVVKNNYFWVEDNLGEEDAHNSTNDSRPAPSFLANGDRAVVKRVCKQRELYGFHFADATLLFPDYNDFEIDVTILTDTLYTDAPALTKEQSDQLFAAVEEDYMDITQRQERIKAIMKDKYYNALQIKFAYAITCHKAQGGQWSHVYVDQGYMTDDMLTPDYIHWLYTAFTRATKMLYLVNWPDTQTEKENR